MGVVRVGPMALVIEQPSDDVVWERTQRALRSADETLERFYRATSSRTQPGSGLGLSIVEHVAAAHGGSAFARNHPDGGAVVGFSLWG